MLKRALFSPARPLRAETRLFPGVVLSRPSPSNVPPGDRAVLAARGGRVEKEHASVAEFPAALLGCHFEHPAGTSLLVQTCGPSKRCYAEMAFLRLASQLYKVGLPI